MSKQQNEADDDLVLKQLLPTGTFPREIVDELRIIWDIGPWAAGRRLDNALRRLKKVGKAEYKGRFGGWVPVPGWSCCRRVLPSPERRQRVMRSGAPTRRSTSIKP